MYQSSRGNTPTLLNTVLGKPKGSMSVRSNWIAHIITVIKEKPIGLGFWDADFVSKYGKLPMAPFQWLLTGGYMGLGIISVIILYINKKFTITEFSKTNSISRYLALALIVQIGIGIVHSNWFDPIFFITLAMLLRAQGIQAETI